MKRTHQPEELSALLNPAHPSSLSPHPSTVTAIERQPRRNRYNVFVDGTFALALEAETLAAAHLAVGSPVAGNVLMDLAAADLRKRALDAALHLLGYRPRSEHEIRTRLARRDLPPDVIAATIARLHELGLLDDAAFAAAWVEARAAGAGARGQRLIKQELRRKGVGDDVADEAVTQSDDTAAAQAAAAKKARSLRGLDYPTFRTRLTGYLQRRGFGYDAIKPAVQAMWAEHGAGAAPDEEAWPEE